MGFMEKVKAKAEEWEVHAKAEKLAAEVEKAAHEAKEKAAAYAGENRDKIRHGLDKAGAKIDERTEGRYADKIAKAKEQVTRGVDKLAEQRTGGSTPGSAAGGTATGGYAPGGSTLPAADVQEAAATPSSEATPGYTAEPHTPEPYRPDPIDRAAPIRETEPGSGSGWPQDAPPKP